MTFINTKRGPNFSLREVEKLIQLVELHRNVINNKGTDSATNAAKIEAWKEIERAFNDDDTCHVYRPHYVLRTKFDNLKRLQKRKAAARKSLKKNRDSINPTDSPTNDEDVLIPDIVVGRSQKKDENFDMNVYDSSSEAMECLYSDTEKTSSFTTAVTELFQRTDRKYFLKDVDDHEEDLSDEENEVALKRQRVSPFEETTTQHQDSCITQSSGDSFLKKRKRSENVFIPKKSSTGEMSDLRKKAFLEKHNLTLKLLKEDAEQRMKHESVLNQLREEELRLRIQFMKEKHEVELNLLKINLTQEK